MDYEYLHICGTCFRLYETGRQDHQEQRCGCDSREEERWPGVDFNERSRLCACCGTEVVESGSRYSPYSCRECQLLAMGSEQLSQWSARVVSRHLKRLGLPAGTPLSRYLAANARDEDRPSRWSLFAEMCEFIGLMRS